MQMQFNNDEYCLKMFLWFTNVKIIIIFMLSNYAFYSQSYMMLMRILLHLLVTPITIQRLCLVVRSLTFGSERYSFSAVGSTSSKGMQIVSTLPALSKAPTVSLFSVLPVKVITLLDTRRDRLSA